MDKNQHYKNKKGTILVAVLIIMIMLAALSAAIISRTTSNVKITSATKKGHSAYQESDSSVEELLNKIRAVDSDENSGEIPENKSAQDFCTGVGTVCFRDDGSEITDTINAKLAEVANVEKSGTDSSSMRAVNVPVPGRIEINLPSLDVDTCGDRNADPDCTWNQCDVKVRWDSGAYPVPGAGDKISGFEVRRSTQRRLDEFGDDDYGWRRAPVRSSQTNPTDRNANFVIVKNGDDNLANQYEQTYFFSLKVKSAQNFSLDSLYWHEDDPDGRPIVTPTQRVVLGAESCPGECRKVIAGGYPGFVRYQATYNCCNDTECYVPE